MITSSILLIIGKRSKFMHSTSGHSRIYLCNNCFHSHLLSIFRTPENQANSNNEIHATNTQDNLENQSNANSGNDTNVQESESQLRRNSSRRRTSPKIIRKQEKFQALLQELSTPTKGEKAENVDKEKDADESVSQNLA